MLQDERGERCIVTGEMELWQKQGERGDDRVFLSLLFYLLPFWLRLLDILQNPVSSASL